MRRSLAGVALWLGGLAAACGVERARIGLELRVTEGLLDTASGVELRVSQGGVCNDAGGVNDESGYVSFDLDRCGSGWCKDVKLDRDGQEHIFHVIASAGGGAIAEGCAPATIDKDPLTVDIKVKKFVPPSCCNNGKLESKEQCDNGIKSMTNCAGKPVGGNGSCNSIVGDEVCACDCLSIELVLSVPGAAPATSNDPASKTELSLAFSGPTGSPDVASSLRAAYTDSQGFGSGEDVNVRLLHGNFTAVTTGALAKQLRMPLSCMSTQGPGEVRIQKSPQLARVSADTVAVVYVNNISQPNQFNVSLVGLGPDGCAPGGELQANVDTSASGDAPDVAGGPEGQALVVWNQAGQIKGRIWSTSGQFTPAQDIAIAPTAMGAKARVGGGGKGWVVAYPGQAGGIFFKTVSTSGTAGAETKVNLAAGMPDSPDVAVHPDGSAAVVWQMGGKIYFQRYDANGMARAGDQDQPLDTSRTKEPASMPVVAADGGKWFAAAWLGADGLVYSRFLGANVFGFNHVTGLNDDFLATHPGVKTSRTGPAIAINDAYVAIGWQDTSTADDHHGMIVRRFPLPE